MKRVLSVVLSLVIVFGVFSSLATTAVAATNSYCIYDGFCIQNSDGQIAIVEYVGKGQKDVVVPAEINGYCENESCSCGGQKITGTVTTVLKSAFMGKTDIVSVTLPDTVSDIGVSAFRNCTNLAEIVLPDNQFFDEITDNMFYGCTSLTEVVVPDSVRGICKNAFYNCSSLTSVVLPEALNTIGASAFSNCKSLTNINLPDNIFEIGTKAFAGCKSIRTVAIPKNVTVVAKSVFESCTGLNDLSIPYGVTLIDENAFKGCSLLASVTVPESVSQVNKNAFANCSSLTYISLPDAVTTIANGVLSGCKSLVNFEFPAYTTVIEANALKGCAALESLVVPDSVYIIGDSAFYGCTGLSNVNIPVGIITINPRVFYNCQSLQSISIPNTVTSIGASAFQACKSLTSVTIPDSVVNIRENAFSNCTALKNVSISKNCETISNNAFSGCKALTSIVVPESVKVIGASAFYGCSDLTSVTINSSLSSIADTAFRNVSDDCVFYCNNNSYAFSFANENGYTARCINHENVDWELVKNATVYSAGSKQKKCFDCGEVIETQIIQQLKCATPKLTKASNTVDGVKVTWEAVEGADSYRVYRRAGGVYTWSFIGTSDTTSFTDTKAQNNKYWIYTVIAVNEAGYSGFDKVGKTVKFVTAPKVTGVSNTANGLYVKWNAVPGAKEYRVYRKGLNYNSWMYLGTTKNTWFTDSPIRNANGYYYKYTVIAVNDYYSGFYEDCAFTKRLSNPVLKSAVSSKSGITVRWNSVYGSTGYYVYRKTAGSGWTLVGSTKGATNESYVDKTAQKGVTYTYTVRAYYGKTLSSYNASGITAKDLY